MHGRHREASRQRDVPGLLASFPAQVQPAALQQLHGSRDLQGPRQLRPGRHLRLLRRLLRHLLPGQHTLRPTLQPSEADLMATPGLAVGLHTHVRGISGEKPVPGHRPGGQANAWRESETNKVYVSMLPSTILLECPKDGASVLTLLQCGILSASRP